LQFPTACAEFAYSSQPAFVLGTLSLAHAPAQVLGAILLGVGGLKDNSPMTMSNGFDFVAQEYGLGIENLSAQIRHCLLLERLHYPAFRYAIKKLVPSGLEVFITNDKGKSYFDNIHSNHFGSGYHCGICWSLRDGSVQHKYQHEP
jgi:hypothetical protein